MTQVGFQGIKLKGLGARQMAFSLCHQRDEQNHVGEEKMATMDDTGNLLL